MGRYLIGSAEFDYRYIYGEQPRNLAYLARAAGVGECRLRVMLHPLRDEQDAAELATTSEGLVPYARLVDHGGARGLRFDGQHLILPEPGDPIRFLEELEESLADDARLLERVEGVRLSGARAYIRAAYRLPRTGWPLLLAWISSHLSEAQGLRLENLVEAQHLPDGQIPEEGPLELALAALRQRDSGSGSIEAFLPLTALHILRHAVGRGLEEMWVEEADAGWDLLLWRRTPQDDQIAALTARLERSPAPRRPGWGGRSPGRAGIGCGWRTTTPSRRWRSAPSIRSPAPPSGCWPPRAGGTGMPSMPSSRSAVPLPGGASCAPWRR